jgi:hypothetical protein
LGRVFPDSGVSGTPVFLYLAQVEHYGRPEANEGIADIYEMPPSKVAELIADGSIDDAFTMCAFLRARLRGWLT